MKMQMSTKLNTKIKMRKFILFLAIVCTSPFLLKAQVTLLSFEIPANRLSSQKLLVTNSSVETEFNFQISLMRAAQSTGGYVPGNCIVTLLYTESLNNIEEATASLSYESHASTIELMTPKNVISSNYTNAIANFDGSKAIAAKLPPNKTSGRIIFRYKYYDNIAGRDVIKYSTTRYGIVLPPSVPTTFYNVARSFTFNKNNCSTSGSGSAVVYTVPASSYSSTISQADADAKAQNDINNNGQNYANSNGTCSISYDNWFTFVDSSMKYGSDWSAGITWNKDLVSTSTVSFEVYQNDVFKGVYAANVPNTGSAFLDFTNLITLTGHTFYNVKLRIVSDNDPSISDFIGPFDMQID